MTTYNSVFVSYPQWRNKEQQRSHPCFSATEMSVYRAKIKEGVYPPFNILGQVLSIVTCGSQTLTELTACDVSFPRAWTVHVHLKGFKQHFGCHSKGNKNTQDQKVFRSTGISDKAISRASASKPLAVPNS